MENDGKGNPSRSHQNKTSFAKATAVKTAFVWFSGGSSAGAGRLGQSFGREGDGLPRGERVDELLHEGEERFRDETVKPFRRDERIGSRLGILLP